MKKFLSICLVALCSISAMYAQTTESTTPTPSEDTRTGVECGTEVKVSATAANKHFHFDRWEIKDIPSTGASTTIGTIGKGQTSTIQNATATSTSSKTGQDNDIEKEELTVTLNGSLISAATSGTLTFEAFFTEDQKYGITIKVVDEAGNELGTVDYQILTNNIPTNYTGETVNLTVDNVASSCYEFDHWSTAATGGSNLGQNKTYTATYGSEDTIYYAVYKKRTVTIKVTTADNTKGTVSIVTPAAPQQ